MISRGEGPAFVCIVHLKSPRITSILLLGNLTAAFPGATLYMPGPQDCVVP